MQHGYKEPVGKKICSLADSEYSIVIFLDYSSQIQYFQ